jgi:hypothetical protein
VDQCQLIIENQESNLLTKHVREMMKDFMYFKNGTAKFIGEAAPKKMLYPRFVQ